MFPKLMYCVNWVSTFLRTSIRKARSKTNSASLVDVCSPRFLFNLCCLSGTEYSGKAACAHQSGILSLNPVISSMY